MRFFIPEWDDRVDPGYDFLTDTHSDSHNEDPSHNDAYMWDIFGIDKTPFDGVLVSLATIQKTRSKYKEILESGIHKFLRLPVEFPIMADCGAFSYIKENEPPYRTNDVLKTYSDLGFNYGVTVDHLVVPAFKEQNNKRIKMTYENGIKGYNIWKKRYKEDFQLIVAVQGAEIHDYLDMFDKFYQKGVRHFAFGSLVRAQTPFIEELVDSLWDDIRNTKKEPDFIHFFGVARCALFKKYKELEDLGIAVSFDSASYLRKAWLASADSQTNFLDSNWNGYTAIRIPQEVPRAKKSFIAPENYDTLSKTCLNNLKEYSKDECTFEEVLASLRLFNETLQQDPKLLTYYSKVLKEQPWKHCTCPICNKIGIEVLIFRGNNRNRRRGFHNTFIFNNMLKEPSKWINCKKKELPKKFHVKEEKNLDFLIEEKNVLIIVSCTKSKLGYDNSTIAPAKEMYKGTLFRKIQEYTEAMNFDYFIISAKYGVLQPNDPIEGYEMVLRTNADIELIRPEVELKLKRWLSPYDTIVVIAGENYRKVLKNIVDKRFVFVKSRGIGDLISIVSRAIPAKNKQLSEFL